MTKTRNALNLLKTEHIRLSFDVWKANEGLRDAAAELEGVRERRTAAEAGIAR
jgi:hypothetical protein